MSLARPRRRSRRPGKRHQRAPDQARHSRRTNGGALPTAKAESLAELQGRRVRRQHRDPRRQAEAPRFFERLHHEARRKPVALSLRQEGDVDVGDESVPDVDDKPPDRFAAAFDNLPARLGIVPPVGLRHRPELSASRKSLPAASIGMAAMSAALVAVNNRTGSFVLLVVARGPKRQRVFRRHAFPPSTPFPSLDNAAKFSQVTLRDLRARRNDRSDNRRNVCSACRQGGVAVERASAQSRGRRLKSTPSGAPGRTGFQTRLARRALSDCGRGDVSITFEDGASFDLYIIPVHTPSRDHQDYQVVFN